MPTPQLAAAALAAAALALAPAAFADTFPGSQLTLLSRTASGAPAGGDAGGATISGDGRRATVAAFDSTSSALTGGTAPGVRNVFTVSRGGSFDDSGGDWQAGAVGLISSGLGGAPADGDSFGASLGGTSRLAPRCIAFVSSASNLVHGDTNGVADAFVRDLATGRITRASVSSSGAQANGPTSAVAVDGKCDAVAFVTQASDLALMHTRRPSWRSAVTTQPPAGTKQVYVRFLGGPRGIDRAVRGLTMLLSATRGRAGNADSDAPAFARNGSAVAFASGAGNLSGAAGGGASQIYERTLRRAFGRRIHHHRVQSWRLATRLVSLDGTGRAGNGASTDPAVNVDGSAVAYTTTASNLIGSAASSPQVVRTKLGGATALVSHTAGGGPGDAASGGATTTDAGSFVAFVSTASNLGARNAAAAAPAPFLWVESPRDMFEFNAAEGATGPERLSGFGNYLAFSRGGDAFLLHVGAR